MDLLKQKKPNQQQDVDTEGQKEIEDRLRRRYLDRLSQKVKVLRKNLMQRDWEALRTDLRQLVVSGDTFGFKRVTELAQIAALTIPSGRVTKASHLPEAKPAIEALVSAIDDLLIDHSIYRA
jgi:hypothetical protein